MLLAPVAFRRRQEIASWHILSQFWILGSEEGSACVPSSGNNGSRQAIHARDIRLRLPLFGTTD